MKVTQGYLSTNSKVKNTLFSALNITTGKNWSFTVTEVVQKERRALGS